MPFRSRRDRVEVSGTEPLLVSVRNVLCDLARMLETGFNEDEIQAARVQIRTVRYFSRTLLMSVQANNEKKQVGAARLLEEAAMKVSSALPAVLNELRSITIEEVSSQVDSLKEVMNEDIRILEGIALQLVVTKKILRLCQREHLYEDVQWYLTEVLIPSYVKLMTSHNDATPPKPVPEARPTSELVQIDVTSKA